MQTTWAYISNNFIYSSMGVFALSFLAHAFETAWAVKVPAEGTDAGSGSSNDYIDIPISDGREEITTESKKLDVDDQKVLEEMKKAQEKSEAEKAAAEKAARDSINNRKRGFLKKLLRGRD